VRILVIPRVNREFCAVENCEFFATDVRNHAHCTPSAFVYDRPCMLSTRPAYLYVDVRIICVWAVKVFAFVTHPLTHRYSHEKGQAYLRILRSCTWNRWVSYCKRVIKRHPCHLSPLNVMLLPVMCFMSSGGHRFKSRSGHQLSWLTFACFPQFREQDSRMMSQVKLTLLPSAVFPLTSVAVHPTFRRCIVKSCWQCL